MGRETCSWFIKGLLDVKVYMPFFISSNIAFNLNQWLGGLYLKKSRLFPLTAERKSRQEDDEWSVENFSNIDVYRQILFHLANSVVDAAISGISVRGCLPTSNRWLLLFFYIIMFRVVAVNTFPDSMQKVNKLCWMDDRKYSLFTWIMKVALPGYTDHLSRNLSFKTFPMSNRKLFLIIHSNSSWFILYSSF